MNWHIYEWNVRVQRVGAALLAAAILLAPKASGDEPVKEGGWLKQKDARTGITVETMEMTLHPTAEARPALAYRLVPDDFEMIEGNAAIYYLKAMGFLEQDPARGRLREIYEQSADRARKENKPSSEVPPYLWLSMSPGELP